MLTVSRTPLYTAPSLSLDSSLVLSSIGLVSGFHSPSVVLVIASTPSACLSPFTRMSGDSIFLLVLCSVFAPVSCGRPKAPSCCPTPTNTRKELILLGSGVSSMSVLV